MIFFFCFLGPCRLKKKQKFDLRKEKDVLQFWDASEVSDFADSDSESENMNELVELVNADNRDDETAGIVQQEAASEYFFDEEETEVQKTKILGLLYFRLAVTKPLVQMGTAAGCTYVCFLPERNCFKNFHNKKWNSEW